MAWVNGKWVNDSKTTTTGTTPKPTGGMTDFRSGQGTANPWNMAGQIGQPRWKPADWDTKGGDYDRDAYDKQYGTVQQNQDARRWLKDNGHNPSGTENYYNNEAYKNRATAPAVTTGNPAGYVPDHTSDREYARKQREARGLPPVDYGRIINRPIDRHGFKGGGVGEQRDYDRIAMDRAGFDTRGYKSNASESERAHWKQQQELWASGGAPTAYQEPVSPMDRWREQQRERLQPKASAPTAPQGYGDSFRRLEEMRKQMEGQKLQQDTGGWDPYGNVRPHGDMGYDWGGGKDQFRPPQYPGRPRPNPWGGQTGGYGGYGRPWQATTGNNSWGGYGGMVDQNYDNYRNSYQDYINQRSRELERPSRGYDDGGTVGYTGGSRDFDESTGRYRSQSPRDHRMRTFLNNPYRQI